MSTDPYQLPADLRVRMEAELKPGETVTWAGQPTPGGYARTARWSLRFYRPMLGASLVMLLMVLAVGGPKTPFGVKLIGVMVTLPFLLLGLAGVLAAPWKERMAATVVYAVTNQRAFSIEGRNSLTVRNYPAAQITNVVRTEFADGSGDLILQQIGYRQGRGSSTVKSYGFSGLPDVKLVERTLQTLLAKA